ncbi:supervillin isoform X3 [Agrilus planipennis]|nr:supervillin isoform X3 [Agrilus planipennis]XP_025829133.1 supervillin isoform X3 [Agrilus planipennis]XP_025829134.1 supervillin isoform X3 [Agrilus planipennis]
MNGNMYSPLMARRPAGTGYDFPEKEVKKDKKWSFGNIFRRKKKNLSESSSDDENNKMSFLQRRKKKSAARKKSKQALGTFDHVVIPQFSRGTYNTLYRNNDDPTAVFSDPTHDAANRASNFNTRSSNSPSQYLNVNCPGSDRSDVNVSRNSLASVDSISKKNRKEMTKARAEARRETLKYESSSDEESQRSGSSAAKFRSDESLSKYGSWSRRTRGARTERYLRRFSKDEDFRDPKQLYKTEIENGRLKMRSPSKNVTANQPYLTSYTAFDPSGMLTIPPSHNTSKRNRNFTVTTCCFDNGFFPETKPTTNANQRSMSYESHIDQRLPIDVVHGRLPLGIPTCQNGKTPPLPPPRDPRRIVTITSFDSSRPSSYCLETATDCRNGLARNRSPLVMSDKRIRNASDITGMYYSNVRSTSEDQIPAEPIIHSLTVRPASTTPDMNGKCHQKDHNDFSLFLTDSKPRSRKPLNIHSFARTENNNNINNLQNGRSKAYQTFNFWRQKEDEVKRHKSEPITKILPKSPILSNKLNVAEESKNDVPQSALLVSAITKSPVERIRGLPREPSPFRPISPAPKIPLGSLNRSKSVSPGLHIPSESFSDKSLSPNINSKKPENLEDALNELEEIYNSLRLGDEDLLDRAEKRERDICKEAATNLMNGNSKRKRVSSRSADIKEDDLAFRKYSKERSKTIGDPHSVASSISYLLASPLSGEFLDRPEPKQKNKKEPDVTFDDLVYRNIKQTNNSLKVIDPQPPFGIPLGPISSAPNSDYLHADPEVGRKEKISKKIPDIVKDDLAYRSLRKDPNKEPALPPSSPIGDANNNKMFFVPVPKYNPNGSFKKKRAVRSLSANIFNLMQKEHDDRVKNELEIAKSLTEIADAMEQTRLMLKEQDKSISETRKGFASDGEALYASQHSPKLEAMKRNRANFLDEMKSFEFPMLPSNSLDNKINNNESSNPEQVNSTSKTLDELLTALAVETRETSDRITNELRMLDEKDILRKSSQSLKSHESESSDKNQNVFEKTSQSDELLASKTTVDSNANETVSKAPISSNDNFASDIPAVVEEMYTPKNQIQTEREDEIPVELITMSLADDSNDKADHAKMCQKLMECVVENAEIVSDEIESDHVQQILLQDTEELCGEGTVASIVLTPKEEDALMVKSDPIEAEVHSEPDYENLKYRDEDENDGNSNQNSDYDDCDVKLDDLNENVEASDADNESKEDFSDGDVEVALKDVDKALSSEHTEKSDQVPTSPLCNKTESSESKQTMSEIKEGRAERMARYKEERRRQLAFQFDNVLDESSQLPNKTRQNYQTYSSSSDEPRTTRASRLRAAAAAALATNDNHNSTKSIKKEKSPICLSSGCESQGSSKPERDKSGKRKSNLNRAHTSEEVPDQYGGEDNISRRRRRRFFPSEVLEQTKEAYSSDGNRKSDNDTACIASPTSSLSTTSSRTRSPPRRSELSIHMQNARKGILPSYSEMGKYRTPSSKTATINTREKYKPFSAVENELSHSVTDKDKFLSKVGNKENIKHNTSDKDIIKVNNYNVRKDGRTKSADVCQSDKLSRLSSVSKRMDELTALTRETLARVEKLSHATFSNGRSSSSSKIYDKISDNEVSSSTPTHSFKHVSNRSSDDERRPPSILKKKLSDEIVEHSTPITASVNVPVSILKRKSSHEDHKISNSAAGSASNLPVTFSPSVIDHSSSSLRKQGILKKRRSLDESHVHRQRSCSPEGKQESRSILKDQRRSSLEMIRSKSPDALQSILKRKIFRNDDEVYTPLNSPEPQGILKRRSGVSSAGSSSNAPHISITTAVILAAAGGAEMVLEANETVKPILKKKSSDELSVTEPSSVETPKPILKKKSSVEKEPLEDKPKKPILKHSRSSYEERDSSDNSEVSRPASSAFKSCQDEEFEVKPILKQPSRENSPRPRLSFCEDNQYTKFDDSHVVFRKRKIARRSHTISTDVDVENVMNKCGSDESSPQNTRPLSVCEMIKNFEKNMPSTGAVPKRSSLNRNSDRYHTQPITFSELEASLSSFHKTRVDELPSINSSQKGSDFDKDVCSMLNFEPTNETNYIPSTTSSIDLFDTSNAKMSTDSAFQSLGDGLELEQDEQKTTPPKSPVTKSLSKSQLQMKSLAEEAKLMALKRAGSNASKYRSRRGFDPSDKSSVSRFSTQPVTTDEVQEAAKMKSGDQKSSDLLPHEPRGILKSKTYASPASPEPSFLPKSVLKKREDAKLLDDSKSSLRSILKQESAELARDEGISSDESDSDVDLAIGSKTELSGKVTSSRLLNSDDGMQTSDGESSGGREIRNILSRDPSFRRRSQERYSKENYLSKSQSQGVFQHEDVEYDGGGGGLRRSLTQSAMPQKIAELQAKLQKSGDSDWRKRIPKLNSANEELSLLNVKNRYNDELNEKNSILKARKEELDAASNQWRNRIEQSDSLNFSVAGRMQKNSNDIPIININLPKLDNVKRTPKAKIFKGKADDDAPKITSLPVSPEKTSKLLFPRSISSPGGDVHDASVSPTSVRKVTVIRPDDITFKTFFESIDSKKLADLERVPIDDLDCVVRESDNLLVYKRDIKFRRKHETRNNPIKVLASRTDIKDEYTEIITGVAEREKKRQNIEKLSKNSNLAAEALAGLASKEDFAAVSLKKSSSFTSSYVPFKDTMLIHVKGRRHVQTRLIEPKVENINEGDSYILIKGNTIYSYTGSFSNIIEQSRASDIINHIQKTNDMGCKGPKFVTVTNKKIYSSKDSENFWNILQTTSDVDVVGAGHPDEDEIYENSIIGTNMIYQFKNDELVPMEEYWGGIPKIKMLEPSKVFVFDFGSEMYVWSGKNAPLEDKRKALKLARELWTEGYNYIDCHVSPLNVASMLGSREKSNIPLKCNSRPDWALFAKLTQHRETILFREKFLDWPDYSRVIKVKSSDEKNVDASFDLKPCDVNKMLNTKPAPPSLEVDGMHLGRGKSYFDPETNRLFKFTTLGITCWIILEYSHEKIQESSVGQFFNGNSYIIRWQYRATVTGRELSGRPSKHSQVGRDRCLYFCWQGNNATINEKGAAALLTVELDLENARQIRVVQGQETPAFLNLFNGGMVVHDGKYEGQKLHCSHRLFISRGEVESETVLTELPCTMRSLRSRASFVLINTKSNHLIIWHGRKSSKQTRIVTEQSVDKIVSNKPREFGFSNEEKVKVDILEEGKESDEFFSALGGENRQLYNSLEKSKESFDYTPRMFHLTSISGSFEANEILCPHRSEHVTPYPFLQSDLYSANQPALFLFDNDHELWLWQGWWPLRDDDADDLGDQTGSGAVRWQAERKASMDTALNYYKTRHPGCKHIEAYLVWSGLEPLKFTNLFPFWTDKDDIAELNIKEGRKAGDSKSIEAELALLTQETYPLSQILQRPLPEGVDPTQLEKYLSSEDFLELTSITIEDFQKLPAWKQAAIKKEKGLF